MARRGGEGGEEGWKKVAEEEEEEDKEEGRVGGKGEVFAWVLHPTSPRGGVNRWPTLAFSNLQMLIFADV